MDDAFAGIVLALALDQKPLIGIAKLRAARRLWARVTEACEANTPAAIEARSSHRMLTIADPWSNLIRLTMAAFAGAVGGADALVLYPHDAATGSQHPAGARLARNTGLVLMEESALGRVIDPAAGGFALEALTDQLARTGVGGVHRDRARRRRTRGRGLRAGRGRGSRRVEPCCATISRPSG